MLHENRKGIIQASLLQQYAPQIFAGVRIIGFMRQSLAIVLFGARQIAHLLQHRAKIAMQRGRARRQYQRRAKRLFGAAKITAQLGGNTKIGVRGREAGIGRHCRAPGIFRFSKPVQFAQHIAQPVIDHGVRRLKLAQFAIEPHLRLKVTQRLRDIQRRLPVFGISGRRKHRLLQLRHRFDQPTLPRQRDTQDVLEVRLGSLFWRCLPQYALGRSELPGAQVRNCITHQEDAGGIVKSHSRSLSQDFFDRETAATVAANRHDLYNTRATHLRYHIDIARYCNFSDSACLSSNPRPQPSVPVREMATSSRP